MSPEAGDSSLQEVADADRTGPSVHRNQWALQDTLSRISASVGEQAGVSYLDVFSLSAMRPDAALGAAYFDARFPNNSRRVDCVHYCLPGPPDTWNRLLFSLLHASAEEWFGPAQGRRKGARREPLEPETVAAVHEASRRPTNFSQWQGWRRPAARRQVPALRSMPWWPQ